MEKRKYPRFQVTFPIAFSGDQTTGKGQAINISMGGCAVESETIVEPGTYLRLRIFFPSEEAPVGIDLAAVRWSTGQAFGVEFIKIDAEAQQVLQRFLETLQVETGR